jgi:hypothetical protein
MAGFFFERIGRLPRVQARLQLFNTLLLPSFGLAKFPELLGTFGGFRFPAIAAAPQTGDFFHGILYLEGDKGTPIFAEATVNFQPLLYTSLRGTKSRVSKYLQKGLISKA